MLAVTERVVVRKYSMMRPRSEVWSDCGGKCNYRCSKADRHGMCIRACNSCCNKCNCVPPGTSGNKDMCPCYASLTTHGGKPKCP
ncbi:hypothetical protein RJT34_24772 [Clitoria ternatea]|uniref:Uncharacterized protein n=1 Tax=Clitoria ternatea TaxID=43366 RepID=A0AAN9IJH1_CLITE